MGGLLSFESLAGVRPGVSTLSTAVARFGPAVVSESSDGGWFFSFERQGIHIIVDRGQCAAADPVVSEIRLTPPSIELLPCGSRVGQGRAEAVESVRRAYRVRVEYDDAIYFFPGNDPRLLASVEFSKDGVVTSIELMHKAEGWE
jgi:hypothetical protein